LIPVFFVKFLKPYFTAEQHIDLMRSRGLVVNNEGFAAHWLERVGYFRLTGYALHFRVKDADKRLTDSFLSGTRFEDIVELYEFDRHLRVLILDAVERFEVAFRTRFNNAMAARYGPHWFLQEARFSARVDKEGKKLFDHTEFLEAAAKHQQTPFIKKYFSIYSDPPYPPCWMLAETITFGTWSRAYSMLEVNQDQKPVSDAFRLSVKEMVSWSQAITDLRNKCAHQSRVWDGRFSNGPRTKGNLRAVVSDNQTLFAQVAALAYCLWAIEPGASWLDRLEELLRRYAPAIRLELMGFPAEWKRLILSLKTRATGEESVASGA
jgi:abortive infection bacteriophage resistance protein